MHQTYVGSQPIYNKDLEIHAYQLLFRNGLENRAKFDNADQATSELILHSLTDIGLDKLVGKHKACIKFTRSFLVGEYPIPRLNDRIIVECLENMEIDEDVIQAMLDMAQQGFTLAMPEAVYLKHFSDKSDYHCIVKFDIQSLSLDEIKARLDKFKNNNVHTLAEKIETQEEFQACNQIGFDYYGGYFFCHPQIIKGKGIPADKLQLTKLIGKLQDETTSDTELENLISSDITLSYRLLRYANSSSNGFRTRIDSIKHAVSLLGRDTVKMIATLLSLANITDKPRELFLFGLIRARMCEQLSDKVGGIDRNMAFTAGLLSIIDALFDSPIEDVLANLPLNEALTRALLDHDGELGQLLHDVIAYINNQQDEPAYTQLLDGQLTYAYIQSLIWANSIAPLLDAEEYH